MKKFYYRNRLKELYVFLQLFIFMIINVILVNPPKIKAQVTTPTPTVTASATPISTLTTQTATPSATNYEMPESGMSLPSILGLSIGFLLLLGSIILAL